MQEAKNVFLVANDTRNRTWVKINHRVEVQ